MRSLATSILLAALVLSLGQKFEMEGLQAGYKYLFEDFQGLPP